MSKKNLIKKILDKLSEEDLQDLLDAEEQEEFQQRASKPKKTINKGRQPSRKKQQGPSYDDEEDDIKTSRKRKSFCKKEQMNISRKRKNAFRDQISELGLDASERRELEKASKEDEQIRENFVPSSRRPPVKLLSVQCCVCGVRKQVAPILVRDISRYKCNSCEVGR